MDTNKRDWQEEGPEDCEQFEELTFDPLLELAAQLALCYDAIEQNIGSFCTKCTCDLGYHLSCDNGECEYCGCYQIYRNCVTCGNARPLDIYPVGMRECRYCLKIPPVKIKPFSKTDTVFVLQTEYERRDRDKEARMVLKELTE